MKIPRVWHLYYGIVIIWASRYIKRVVKKTGEQMKVVGRILVACGDETTPRWSREIFQKCYLADTEIHFGSEIFLGLIDAIYQEHSGKESELIVTLKKGCKKKRFCEGVSVPNDREFRLKGYGKPVFIKEWGCDCLWTSFDGGYLAIFFR